MSAILVRWVLSALLIVAAPAIAQSETSFGGAVEAALRCVRSVKTDALLPVGLMREQLAESALSRCYDEIEAAALAIASPKAPAARVDAARAALRRDLYLYAVQSAPAAAWSAASPAERDSGLLRVQLRE